MDREREREIGNWNRWGLIGVEFGLESALVGIKPGAWTKGWEGVMGVIRAWLVNDWYDRINRRDYHSDDRFSLRWTLSKEFFFSICFCSRRHIGLSSINKNEGVTHKEDVVVIIYVYMEKLGKKFPGIGNECKMETGEWKNSSWNFWEIAVRGTRKKYSQLSLCSQLIAQSNFST